MDKGKAQEYQTQIRDAIGAHGMWKNRLNDAISTGSSSVSVMQAQTDNACEFGRWLSSHPEMKVDAPTRYDKVRQLHHDFHACTGKVLALALSGKGAEATKLTERGSDYSKLTGALVLELMNWSRDLEKA